MKPTMFSPPITLFLLSGVLFLFLPFRVAADASPISEGDSKEQVLEELGQPNGAIGSDRFRILYFERGEVYLRDGLVERTELVSPEKAKERRIAREERRAERRLARERERQERIEEGESIRDEKLISDSFIERPARERLAFWRTFSRHYPEVDVSFELDVTRAEVAEKAREEERAERRERQRMELEQRTRDAEVRAARAERAAEEAEIERRRAIQRPRIFHSAPTYIIRPDGKSGSAWRDRDRSSGGSGPGRESEAPAGPPRIHLQSGAEYRPGPESATPQRRSSSERSPGGGTISIGN